MKSLQVFQSPKKTSELLDCSRLRIHDKLEARRA